MKSLGLIAWLLKSDFEEPDETKSCKKALDQSRKFIRSRVMIRQEIDYKSGSLRIIRFGV